MPEFKYLQTRREGATLVVTLDNPPKRALGPFL